MKKHPLYPVLGGIISLSILGYGGYTYHKLSTSYKVTKLELASTTENLAMAQNQNEVLHSQLSAEVSRNDAFDQQIQSISSTVGVLDKLNKTDKELLQKYSKVYFLNENFVPSALASVDSNYLFNKKRPEEVHASVLPYLEKLLKDANDGSVPLSVLSAYRSFGTQGTLKAQYKVTYGAGSANKFSADQGYSEHQLGSAVDFTTPTTGEDFNSFEKTSAFTWLQNNAYKYGFILSYPKANTFYQSEPWHWRFVGVELATKLHDTNVHFYDLDQREINTYLSKIFD